MSERSAPPAGSDASTRPASLPSAHVDLVLYNALRYTVSGKEYKNLHHYLVSRSPTLRRRSPTVAQYETLLQSKHQYNSAAVRVSLRVFVASLAGLNAWDALSTSFRARFKGGSAPVRSRTTFLRSSNFRLSLSISSILLLHRLIHRFFTLLRENLLTADARPFRKRNPRVSRVLVSRLAPAVGASAAGFILGVCPNDQLRVSIAIYAFTKAAEFLYNKLEDDGWFRRRPWWFGSWLITPVACGQLLHSFVFDPDCHPKPFGDFVMNHTPNYIQRRPDDYPSHLQWPAPYEIIDNFAKIARLNYPPFISPILFPNSKTLPDELSSIAPIVDSAHPAIKALPCALLHPHDPSCLRTYITFFIQAFPPLARFFTLVLALFSLPRYRTFLKSPVTSLDRLARTILRMTTFITGAIGTSWAAICFFQHLFPRNFLPTQRVFLGGFIGGLWGFLERKGGRGRFLYTARASIDSTWRVAVKRGWVRGIRHGDVWLFVMSLAVTNAVFEINPRAVNSGVARRVLGSLRGEAFVDRLTDEPSVDGKGVTEDGKSQ